MGSKLIFNGVSSEDLGIVIQAPPTYPIAEKDITVTHVQGRTGDVLTSYKSYQNVEMAFSLACVFKNETNFVSNAQAITDWLSQPNGYKRLEHSYDPDVYRMAILKEATSLQNYYDQVTVSTVTFTCKPQRFYKSGEKNIEIENGDSLTNPSKEKACPLISFNQTDGSIESKLIITNDAQSYVVTISPTLKSDTIYIDCEVFECYTSTSLCNNKVSIDVDEFPGLNKGKSIITFENISNLKIKPRWWSL